MTQERRFPLSEQCTLEFDTSSHLELSIGFKVGKLTVTGPICHNQIGVRCYPCRCDCGQNILRPIYRIIQSKSCQNCLNARGHGATRNGKIERLYSIWNGIKGRCLYPSHKKYSHYGGKGVSICPEWSQYIAFREWALDNGYCENLTIDRIEGNGNYEPSNCRWITQREQTRNTSRNVWITALGETKLLEDWLRDSRCAISNATYKNRIRKGWLPYDALFTHRQGVGGRPSRPK